MKQHTIEEFISKAQNIHKMKYDYSESVYCNGSTPMTIICKEHGKFAQKPVYHLKGSGCSKCYRQSRTIDSKEFSSLAESSFGDDFAYGEYQGYRHPIKITCKKHGVFETTPEHHLRKGGSGGCVKCKNDNQRVSQNDWINRFISYHGDKYNYDKSVIISQDRKIIVVCPLHGEFFPIPLNHQKGHGCPTCACKNYVGGYGASYFDLYPDKKDLPAILYLIKFIDKDVNVYKIGITTRSVEQRFKSVMPYSFEIVTEYTTTLYDAHTKEHNIKNITKLYCPSKRFPGWTECFVANDEAEIINIITK